MRFLSKLSADFVSVQIFAKIQKPEPEFALFCFFAASAKLHHPIFFTQRLIGFDAVRRY